MKKFIYAVFAVLTLGLTCVACGDDNEDAVYNYGTTPEQATAGTYTGMWIRTSDEGTETYDGSVTIAAGGSAGVANITFSCPSSELNATSIANIWNSNNDFQFVNQVEGNGLGAAFAGRVYADGKLNTSFTITQRVGRKQVKMSYEFIGSK